MRDRLLSIDSIEQAREQAKDHNPDCPCELCSQIRQFDSLSF